MIMRRRSLLALGFSACVAISSMALAQNNESNDVDANAESLRPLDGVYRPDGSDEAGIDSKSAQSSSCAFSARRHPGHSFFVLALPLLFLRRKRDDGTATNGSA
jgi:hypothetical protein